MDKSKLLPGNPCINESDLPEPNYFGDCPVCGGNDGYMNLGADHWFFCARHRTKWLVGANLFSSHMDESEADWHRNHEELQQFTEVEPWSRDEDAEVAAGAGARHSARSQASQAVWQRSERRNRLRLLPRGSSPRGT